MTSVRRLLSWIDENVLFLISGFLLAFIPLFPKLPLFDALPGYIVRVRLEDFLISGALVIWLIQLWRRKATFGPNPLAKPIVAYLTVGILSMLSALFISRTVPLEALHAGKMLLHFLRRVEYFSLFFIFYSSIKSIKQVKVYIGILGVTVVGVVLYGYGQKYLFWPAFSTMNREFSKGWALYLTQHARVLSTFGGHYDLAAFTMMVLVLLWALFFSVEKKWLKGVIFIILGSAFWLLILTASRTSFLAYIAGVTILFGFWMFRKGIRWAAWRWFAVVLLSMVVMLSFGDLSERFTKLLKLDQRLAGIKSLVLRPFGSPPANGEIVFLENNIEAVTSKSDFPPLPIKPSDVTDDLPDGIIASESATASGSAVVQTVVPRTYSQTALVYDLSTGIRLDALWPRAIAGFKKNPLLGTGYSTLTKTQINQFTEAESTDNDFLRALGETGLLGFLTFGWILVSILFVIWKTFTRVRDTVLFGLLIGGAAIVIGLLVNAVYIDVFEASKVAFSFWAFTGIVLGAAKVAKLEPSQKGFPQIPDLKDVIPGLRRLARNISKSPKTYLLLVLILAFVVRTYRLHESLADWHSWRQADTSAVTRNFVRFGMDPLYPRYDDLSSVASGKPNPEGYRFVEFPLYNMAAFVTDKLFPGYTVEYSGRLTSIFASLGTLIFLYLLAKKYAGTRVAFLTAFFFAVLPYNIYWSRVILPEPTLVFLTTGMLYFFDHWLEKDKKRFYILAVIFGACALLVKFTTVFFALPLFYLVWQKWGKGFFKQPLLYIYAVLVVVPFALWRVHIAQFPEGIPAYTWLFNGNGIRLKGAWWWWLFAERIAKLILGGWGVALLVLGLLQPVQQMKTGAENLLNKISKMITHTTGQTTWFFHIWLLSMFVYLVVFATGNVQHDYYQIILVPILCVFLALGTDQLLFGKRFHVWLARGTALVLVSFVLMFGWYQARDFFNVNHPEIVEAGREFDRLIPNNYVHVIAPYGGDTAFLYQTGKKGWPLMEGSIEDMIGKGAHYYISTNYDDLTNELITIADQSERGKDKEHDFKIIKQTDTYVIIQLVSDKMLPNPS